MKRLGLPVWLSAGLLVVSGCATTKESPTGLGEPTQAQPQAAAQPQAQIETTEFAAFAPPPNRFRPVTELTALPEFVPGLGRLYVDPATLPQGPYLGYDRQNRLVNVTYMIPLDDLDNQARYKNLGADLPKVAVEHTDIYYSGGHSGVNKPHYHIVEWLITPEEQAQRVPQQ